MSEQIPPARITNTATDPITPLLILLDGLDGDGGSRAIENMEAQGQRQLVNSDRLPTEGSDNPELAALGFTFGGPDENDPLFRPATLPPGWKRVSSDHNMWSYIVDELGRRRVAVFYKAAFYDRSAFMRVESLEGYLSHCLWEKTCPVLDDAWAKVQPVLGTLERLATEETESASKYDQWAKEREDGRYYAQQADEYRARAATARTWIQQIEVTQ